MAKWFLSALIALVLLSSFGFYSWPRNTLAPARLATSDIQMGFYDLMSSKKEVYNAHLERVNDTILTTITSPDDPRFMLKGKFTHAGNHQGREWFSWSSIYYSTSSQVLMIDGMVDLMVNMDVWMQPLQLHEQPLVVGQNGIIFLSPLR